MLAPFSLKHVVTYTCLVEAATVARAIVWAGGGHHVLTIAAPPCRITKTRCVEIIFPETRSMTTAPSAACGVYALTAVIAFEHGVALTVC